MLAMAQIKFKHLRDKEYHSIENIARTIGVNWLSTQSS